MTPEWNPWREPEDLPGLAAGVVDAWLLDLDPPDDLIARFEATLNAPELSRASRFRREILQRRFVAGRGYLRAILGRYLDIEPSAVPFAYGPQGKPSLADSSSGIEFNLAHSKGLAVCGLTLEKAIGVDVETERPTEMAERIIHRFFSVAEQAEFLNLPEDRRADAFLRGWTRKEAFIKAIGLGLSYPLDGFDVALSAEHPRILRVGDDPEEASRWTLADLPAGDSASVVVQGPIGAIRLHRWSD